MQDYLMSQGQLNNKKFRVSLVFKGTTLGAPKPDETEFTEVE